MSTRRQNKDFLFSLNKGRNGRTNGSYMLPPPFPKRSRSVQACRRFCLMPRGDYHVEISFHEQLSPKRFMSSGRTSPLSGVSYVCPRMEKATGGHNQTVPFGMESIKAFPSQRIVRLFAAETAHPEEPPSSPASFPIAGVRPVAGPKAYPTRSEALARTRVDPSLPGV